MEFVTLGIGTPSSIPAFLLVGLSPSGATIPGEVSLAATVAALALSVAAVEVTLSADVALDYAATPASATVAATVASIALSVRSSEG